MTNHVLGVLPKEDISFVCKKRQNIQHNVIQMAHKFRANLFKDSCNDRMKYKLKIDL